MEAGFKQSPIDQTFKTFEKEGHQGYGPKGRWRTIIIFVWFWDEDYVGISPLGGSVATSVYRFIDGAKMSEEKVREEFQNDRLEGIGAWCLEVFETFEGFVYVFYG